MNHNLKGGVGPFKIFHTGGTTYTVERDGKVLDTVEHISEAYRSAGKLQLEVQMAERADSDDDDDMFDGDEPEPEPVDRQAQQWDHARDHRKHGG